jgi:hypothetical protein
MAETTHETDRRLATARQQLEMGSEIVMRHRLMTIAALAVVLAVALSIYGWGLTVHHLVDALHQLPRPLQTLLGGTRLAHLLDSSR